VARIDYSPDAVADLEELGAWIAARAGEETARRYLARIKRRIDTLEVFPRAGLRVRYRGRNVRLLGFDRRVTILVRGRRDAVEVLRVLYGGRLR
jgi:toxin ParE1/3/4